MSLTKRKLDRIHDDIRHEEMTMKANKTKSGIITHGPPMMMEVTDVTFQEILASSNITETARSLGWTTSNITDPELEFDAQNLIYLDYWEIHTPDRIPPPIIDSNDADNPGWDSAIPIECPQKMTYKILEDEAQQSIDIINEFRFVNGLTPLVWDKGLTNLAIQEIEQRKAIAILVPEYYPGDFEFQVVDGTVADGSILGPLSILRLVSADVKVADGELEGSTNLQGVLLNLTEEAIDDEPLQYIGMAWTNNAYSIVASNNNELLIDVNIPDITLKSYTCEDYLPPADPDRRNEEVNQEAIDDGWVESPVVDQVYGGYLIDIPTFPCLSNEPVPYGEWNGVLPITCPESVSYDLIDWQTRSIVEWLNTMRYDSGLPPIKINEKLTVMAMAQANALNHYTESNTPWPDQYGLLSWIDGYSQAPFEEIPEYQTLEDRAESTGYYVHESTNSQFDFFVDQIVWSNDQTIHLPLQQKLCYMKLNTTPDSTNYNNDFELLVKEVDGTYDPPRLLNRPPALDIGFGFSKTNLVITFGVEGTNPTSEPFLKPTLGGTTNQQLAELLDGTTNEEYYCNFAEGVELLPQEAINLGWDEAPLGTEWNVFNIDPGTEPCPYNVPTDWGVPDPVSGWDGVGDPTCPVVRTYALMEHISQPLTDEVNRYRYDRGMPPLRWNDNLAAAAQSAASWRYDNTISGEYPLVPHSYQGNVNGTNYAQLIAWANYKKLINTGAEHENGNQNVPQAPLHTFCYFKDIGGPSSDGSPGEWNPVDQVAELHLKTYINTPIIQNPETPRVIRSHNTEYGVGWKGGRRVMMFGAPDPLNTHGAVPPIEDTDIICTT
jgi:uncharacterized protein YkwD